MLGYWYAFSICNFGLSFKLYVCITLMYILGTDDKDTALEGGGGDDIIAPMKAAPTMASTPARPGLLGTAAPGTLGSPISDMSDIYTDSE